MKKTVTLLFTLLIVSMTISIAKAQLVPLTYTVTAKNFTFADDITNLDPLVTGNANVVEYDLYIQQTNVPADPSEIMRYALGQYYINLSWGTPGISTTDTTGCGFNGLATFSYIPGSTTFTNLSALPTNPRMILAAATDTTAPFIAGVSRGAYTQLNSNAALGNTSDVQISSVFPGTRIGRYRLRKNVAGSTAISTSQFFPSINFLPHWRRAPTITPGRPSPTSKMFAYNGLGGLSTEVTSKGTYIIDMTSAQILTLNLKILIEGLYSPVTNKMSRKDNVTVFLRNSVSPYSIIDSAKGKIDSITFSNNFTFNYTPTGKYYIVIKHLNSIETWSKAGGDSLKIGAGINYYDFTSSELQAYGNNLKLKGTKYCLYSGNVDNDRIIDASDISAVENDAFEGVTGYVSTDLNGDNIVDGADLIIVDNNKSIAVALP